MQNSIIHIANSYLYDNIEYCHNFSNCVPSKLKSNFISKLHQLLSFCKVLSFTLRIHIIMTILNIVIISLTAFLPNWKTILFLNYTYNYQFAKFYHSHCEFISLCDIIWIIHRLIQKRQIMLNNSCVQTAFESLVYNLHSFFSSLLPDCNRWG